MTENNQNGSAELSYEVDEHIGVMSTSSNGWTKELNLIAWNGRSKKYDIRDWAPDHKKMSRGITLSEYEAKSLYDLLRARFD